MTIKDKGDLLINVCWQDDKLSVRNFVCDSKSFLIELESLSPWCSPFAAIGPTMELSQLEISKDFSNLDEVFLQILSEKNMRFIKDPDDGSYDVSLDSTSYGTCDVTISEVPARKNINERVTIMLSANTRRLNTYIHGISIKIPRFRSGEINAAWGDEKVVRKIVHFLIEKMDPLYLSVIQSDKVYSVLERGVDNYRLGWISYTKNRNFVDALVQVKNSQAFHNGVLIDLGESVTTLDDPETERKIRCIRDHLREAGATDWLATLY